MFNIPNLKAIQDAIQNRHETVTLAIGYFMSLLMNAIGVPNDAPFHQLAGICGLLALRSISRHFRQTIGRVWDYLDDLACDASDLLSSTKNEILYITGHARTFPKFNELPAEIRCLIWEYALPGPRVVSLHHTSHLPGTDIQNYPGRITSIGRIPPLLHTCRESRFEALKTYSLTFGTPSCPHGVYFDFKRDIVSFEELRTFYDLTCGGTPVEGFEKVKRIALPIRDFKLEILGYLRVFVQVEEVALVGEARFGIGRTPRLIFEEDEAGCVCGSGESLEDRLDLGMEKKWERGWRERYEDREMPGFKRGRFVKGRWKD